MTGRTRIGDIGLRMYAATDKEGKRMEQMDHVKDRELVEFFEFKANRFLREVKKKADIYGISVEITDGQMEKLFLDVVEAEREELTEAPEIMRGSVYVRKDGSGTYYSYKNIRFCLTDFFELVVNLTQTETKYRLVVSAIFLIRILKQLGCQLSEEQTVVCTAIYQASKHCALTDDNVLQCIVQELRESNYWNTEEEQIEKPLLKLEEIGFVSIVEGRYEVTEKILFE